MKQSSVVFTDAFLYLRDMLVKDLITVQEYCQSLSKLYEEKT